MQEIFLQVIQEYTAGSPQQDIRWTNLKPREIALKMKESGMHVSRKIVRKLMKKNGFVLRQSQKKTSYKEHPERNNQFEKIARLKEQYLKNNDPVISMDTKKKELIGNFYREGKLYTKETIEVLDHDFPSYSNGKVIPHGIYDIGRNKAHVNLGTSRDTTEFSCDSLKHWWTTVGKHDYPNAKRLLLMCDGGGSNPSNSYLFKQDLQRISDELGLEIRVAHYPAYCSKHNPIEHRVFPHVTRACEGVVFDSIETVKELVSKTKTETGLKVTVDIMTKVYETGRKITKKAALKINFVADKIIPKWNYVINPLNGY